MWHSFWLTAFGLQLKVKAERDKADARPVIGREDPQARKSG